MNRLRGLALGGLVAAAALGAGGRAHAADPDEEARERYDRAIKLYEDADFDGALVELERAYQLRPSYKLLYNIARVRVAMNDYASALKGYRRYLAEGGDKIPSTRRDEVRAEIEKLERRVASLTVEVDVDGAEIYVDDALVGSSPMTEPVLVNAGVRRIAVRHPDYSQQGRRLSIAGGDEESLSIRMKTTKPTSAPTPAPGPEPAPPASAPPPEPAEPTTESGSPWFGWVLTGVFAATTATTGVIALSANSSLKEKRESRTASADDLDSESTRVRTLAIVTDVMLAATLITGGITLWLSLDGGSEPSRDSGTAYRGTQLGVGPTGVSMRMQF
ncbi:MAG: tetratricopeptide repeat protein [Myxococcales bacterium]|nr:tetratricopeptide repeat protein [Myxococcales bacterium]